MPMSLAAQAITLPIHSIDIRNPPRTIDDKAVDDLVESFSVLGLRTPITVMKGDNNKFVLLVGFHRVKAALRLGWKDIPAVIYEGDHKSKRLWQVAENLHRNELTMLERAELTAAWIKLRIIEGQVVPKSGPGRPEGIVAKAARTLPVHGNSQAAREKTVRRALQIDRIVEGAKEVLRKAGLEDNQSALLEVAREASGDSQLSPRRSKGISVSRGISFLDSFPLRSSFLGRDQAHRSNRSLNRRLSPPGLPQCLTARRIRSAVVLALCTEMFV